jgi:hypothetical protein
MFPMRGVAEQLLRTRESSRPRQASFPYSVTSLGCAELVRGVGLCKIIWRVRVATAAHGAMIRELRKGITSELEVETNRDRLGQGMRR